MFGIVFQVNIFLNSSGEFYPFVEYQSVCNSSALWDPPSPIEGCTRWNCGPPLIVTNSEIPAYTMNTLFGDVYVYSCLNGYKAPEDTLTVTCMVRNLIILYNTLNSV